MELLLRLDFDEDLAELDALRGLVGEVRVRGDGQASVGDDGLDKVVRLVALSRVAENVNLETLAEARLEVPGTALSRGMSQEEEGG